MAQNKPGKRPQVTSPLIRHEDAAVLLTSPSILRNSVKAGWFKPSIQRRTLIRYLRTDGMAAVWRISEGEFSEDR